jgi:AbrB family looped-hinge helix DNA binding protein
MKTAEVSKGGQISIPAEIRRRWHTRLLALEDRGDEIVLRPLPEDPLAAAAGSLAEVTMASDQLRTLSRTDGATTDRWQEM